MKGKRLILNFQQKNVLNLRVRNDAEDSSLSQGKGLFYEMKTFVFCALAQKKKFF